MFALKNEVHFNIVKFVMQKGRMHISQNRKMHRPQGKGEYLTDSMKCVHGEGRM